MQENTNMAEISVSSGARVPLHLPHRGMELLRMHEWNK
jgi:anti-sigma factor ChrR (cupin superfamily)